MNPRLRSAWEHHPLVARFLHRVSTNSLKTLQQAALRTHHVSRTEGSLMDDSFANMVQDEYMTAILKRLSGLDRTGADFDLNTAYGKEQYSR